MEDVLKSIKNINLKAGQYRLQVPMLNAGELKFQEFIVDDEILNSFTKCTVKKNDFSNYELSWDYSYINSDDNNVYNKGYEQEKEISKLLINK